MIFIIIINYIPIKNIAQAAMINTVFKCIFTEIDVSYASLHKISKFLKAIYKP